MVREINLLPKTEHRKESISQRFWRWRRDEHVVGVDIDNGAVRACYQYRRKGKIARTETLSQSLPPETLVDGALMNFTAVAEALRELTRQLREKGMPKDARFVLIISGHSVIVKKISIPQMTDEELQESIQWEAEQYIPFDIKDVNVDAEICDPDAGQGQMNVLLVAAKKDVINDYCAVFKEAGLTLSAIEPSVCALARFLNKHIPPEEPQQIRCAVHVGESVIDIVIMGGKGGQIPVFTRDISMGLDLCIEAIMKGLNVSWEEAKHYFDRHNSGGESAGESAAISREVAKLVERVSETLTTEIQRSLDFFAATTISADIAKVFISGPGSQVPILVQAMERRLKVPVKPLQADMAVGGQETSENSPVFGMVTGLAMHQDFTATVLVKSRGWMGRKVVPIRTKQPKQYNPSKEELARFFDILSFGMGHGCPMVDLLGAMVKDDQVGSKKFRRAIDNTQLYVVSGHTLADAMLKYLKLSAVLVEMVRASEYTGYMPEILAVCGRYLQTGFFTDFEHLPPEAERGFRPTAKKVV